MSKVTFYGFFSSLAVKNTPGMRYAARNALGLSATRLYRRSDCLYRLVDQKRFVAMTMRTYDDAVDALNTLQTNFRVLDQRRKAGIRYDENSDAEMKAWLGRIGHSIRDLDRLNIVHVAGTKGKGTICAYTDSILSFYRKSHRLPKKTGLFTSPHLVSVRERIRIDSQTISDLMFAKYFFEVWDALESSTKLPSPGSTNCKPPYFRYLTLMSFHVFLSEGVDVAIYETGVGGQYDSTNVVERPAATGISTLGIDHVFVLGNNIEEIAWHKAGILKSGTPAFTTKQVPQGMKVIESRAKEKGLDIGVVDIHTALKNVKIQPDADFQRTNASLAIALASTVLKKLDPSFKLPESTLPKEFVDGLEQVVWRGRCEIKVDGNLRWYLDGAHNAVSLEVTAQWFANQIPKTKCTTALIFNQQGRDEAVDLLESFFKAMQSHSARFDHVIFCTNVTYARKGYKRDFINHTYDSSTVAALTIQSRFAEKWKSLDVDASVSVASSIEEALDYVKILAVGDETRAQKEIQALVTGSLHLVGGVLAVLEDATAL